MKTNELMKSVSTSITKVGFQLKKHSPEILVVAGVVGTVVSAVMACKATTKVSEILDSSKDCIDSIHDCQANESLAEDYTPDDAKKDLAIVYIQTGIKLAKLYAPAVILGTLSISGILASNNILRKRNVALAAAYTTVDKGFKEYRNRVVERFGEQVDRELKYNIKAKKFEEIEVDPETGKEKKVKKTVNVVDPNACSDYSCMFDKTNQNWQTNANYNMMFLRQQQSYANDLFKARGHLFLNEIYDNLDIPRTKAGNIVGWVYDPKNAVGDNYVDFRIFETQREMEDGYYEPIIMLDFNVDGNVLDLMG